MGAAMTTAQLQAYLARKAKQAIKPARAKKPSSKPPPMSANALTKAIVTMLTVYGCLAWRQNNGAVYDPTRQVFRARNTKKGISDVLGLELQTARFLAVEVKVGKDKLTPQQRQFLADVRAAGGFACEGRELEQVRTEFLAWRQSLPT